MTSVPSAGTLSTVVTTYPIDQENRVPATPANFKRSGHRLMLTAWIITGLAASANPVLGEAIAPESGTAVETSRVSITVSLSGTDGHVLPAENSARATEGTPTSDRPSDLFSNGESFQVRSNDGSVEDLPSVIAPFPAPGAEVSKRFEGLFAETPDSSVLGSPDLAQDRTVYNVPIVVNPRVEGHMRFFHTAIRDRFEQWLVRLGRYKRQVEQIFAQFNLPSDLIFLSLVESGFNPHAYSRARATGPWQFMRGTAKNYGLRVDQYVDERRDPIKSTIAAAQYLRDLYDMFGTWPLAMAAYNAGEGKVMRALQKTQSTSYWEIAQTKHLKKETKDYVPRFMAATIIAKNPDRYGFTEVEAVPHEFEEVLIDRSVHLHLQIGRAHV